MPDYHAHIEEQFAWLLTMARNPATKAHAWHRAKELAADESGLYAGMDKRLEQAMQSDSQSPATPSAKGAPASQPAAASPISTHPRRRPATKAS